MADYLEISEELRQKIIHHYSRPEVISAMIEASPNKEVVGSYGGTGYAKRPDVLEYDNDITVLVKKGVTSFHISEESWNRPLNLIPGMEKKAQDANRIGWDLIIDIDCPHWKICKSITHHLIQEIKAHGIENVSVKFSGNKGFHIGVPQESFPHGYDKDFPEIPRKIATYLLERIMDKAKDDVITILTEEHGKDFPNKVEDIFHKPKDQIFHGKFQGKTHEVNFLDPLQIIEVDTLLISSRHLYRMVYSVNEKSGMISIPINPDKVLQFEKEIAKIDNNVFSKFKFLDRTKSFDGEANKLFIEAIDSVASLDKNNIIQKFDSEEKTKTKAQLMYEENKEKIPEDCFPDAIKKMLEGHLSDGKKRALFVLKNFLSCVGWNYAEIEERFLIWNKTHVEPLKDNIIQGQLLYLKQSLQKKERMLPPNYNNNNYYRDIIGDLPEFQKAKNPVKLALMIYAQQKSNTTQMKKAKRKSDKENAIDIEQKSKRKSSDDNDQTSSDESQSNASASDNSASEKSSKKSNAKSKKKPITDVPPADSYYEDN